MRLLVYRSSIHGFHHAVCGPSSPLHDVLIRNPDGVHNAGGVVTEVMKAKSVGEVREFQRPAETVRNLGGICLDNATVRLRDLRDHKRREFDFPVTGICLRRLYDPFILCI